MYGLAYYTVILIEMLYANKNRNKNNFINSFNKFRLFSYFEGYRKVQFEGVYRFKDYFCIKL